jgi:hypothetical protein
VVLAALDRGSVDDALAAGRVVDAGGLLALDSLATAEEGVAVELQGLAAEGRVAVVDRVDRRPLDELAGLLQSVPEDAPVLLAGDPDRLPGPHPGAVLRDVLAWGEVEVRDLRPATTGPGTLGRLAAAVRAGQLPASDPQDRSLVVVPCADDAAVLHRARQLVADSIPRFFGVTASDIAVLAPLHRGDAGTRALVAALEGSGARVVGLHEAAWAAQRWPAVVACFGAETAGVVSRAMLYELALLATTHLSVVTAVGPALPEAVATGVARQRVTLLAGLLAEG